MRFQYLLVVTVMIFSSGQVFGVAAVQAELRQMAVNGTKLTYLEQGAGDPVVFVHGAISDLRVWDSYRPLIADKRRFIAYTQRYFGTGNWPDKAKSFTRETHVDDLIAFIEELDIGQVHLVTWSYSGEIGTYAALKRPELFRSMIHFEPAVGALLVGAPGGALAQREMVKKFGPAISAVKAKQLDDAALRFLETVFKLPNGGAAKEPEPWPTYWRENGRTIPPFLVMPKSRPINCDELHGLRVPTLVVQGEDTYARYSIIAERLAGCQANALLVTMSGVNHDGPYREPESFVALIENFLSLVD